MNPNKENANVPHGPEATNLTLSERIKKEFALLEVFSQDLADSHMRGDIHLHDLGTIDRPDCSGQSIEYVKKFGLNLSKRHLDREACQASRGADRADCQVLGRFARALRRSHRLGCFQPVPRPLLGRGGRRTDEAAAQILSSNSRNRPSPAVANRYSAT